MSEQTKKETKQERALETDKFDIENLTYDELRVLTNLSELVLTAEQIYEWELFRGYLRYRKAREDNASDGPEAEANQYPQAREEFSKIEDREQLRRLLNQKLKVPVPSPSAFGKNCLKLQKMGWLAKEGEKYLIRPELVSLFEKQFDGLTKEKLEKMKAAKKKICR